MTAFDGAVVTIPDFRRWTDEMRARDAQRPALEPIVITAGDRRLLEGRDFSIDWATGTVRFHESFGPVKVTAGACADGARILPDLPRRRGPAQWKRERAGRRA